MNHINNLVPQEIERLSILVEECGEVIQAATKVLRHGYYSVHPVSEETNLDSLQKELGDLRAAIILMGVAGDIDKATIHKAAVDKCERLKKWVHYQHSDLLATAKEQAA